MLNDAIDILKEQKVIDTFIMKLLVFFREVIVNMLVYKELSNIFVSTVLIYSEKIEAANE